MYKELDVPEIRKHIRKCIRYKKQYSFLGLTENRDLTLDAAKLFESPRRPGWYDWVNGNKNMYLLIREEEKKAGMSNYESVCRRFGIVPEKEE